LSPDKSRIAWASNERGTWDIFASSASESSAPSLRPIAGSDEDETGPAWAPDGKRLAWAAFDRRAAEWRLRIGDGTQEARELGAGFAPAWHPSEDRIVCQRTRPADGLWGAVVIEVASGRATELWPGPGRAAITPSWSRDGRWVLLAARVQRPGADEIEFDGLWAVSSDGVKRLRLTGAGIETWSPRETADGRIVYCRREGDSVELWSFRSPLEPAESPK
jgi:Tol biopolymer transport system component